MFAQSAEVCVRYSFRSPGTLRNPERLRSFHGSTSRLKNYPGKACLPFPGSTSAPVSQGAFVPDSVGRLSTTATFAYHRRGLGDAVVARIHVELG